MVARHVAGRRRARGAPATGEAPRRLSRDGRTRAARVLSCSVTTPVEPLEAAAPGPGSLLAIDLLSLELRAWLVVRTLVEERHFGRAARRLYVSQPGLSQYVRRLERRLGVALVARSSRAVEPTVAGRELARRAVLVLDRARAAAESARPAGEHPLRIGFRATSVASHVGPLVAAVLDREPGLAVEVREIALGDVEPMRRGEVDAALTRMSGGEHPDLEVEVLGWERRVAVLPAGHRLAGRAELDERELGDERFVVWGAPPRAMLPVGMARSGPHLVGPVTSAHGILALVAIGAGIAFVPASAATLYPRPDVAYVPVADERPSVPVSLAWRRGGAHPAIAALRRAARAVVDDPSGAAPVAGRRPMGVAPPQAGVEPGLVRALAAVAEAGSFAGAAARLGAGVSTVTAQVRRLERDLDVELLARDARPTVLTPAGSALLAHADGLFAAVCGYA